MENNRGGVQVGHTSALLSKLIALVEDWIDRDACYRFFYWFRRYSGAGWALQIPTQRAYGRMAPGLGGGGRLSVGDRIDP